MGEPCYFRKKIIGSTFPEQWAGFATMRWVADSVYEILTRDGTIWRYRNGVLERINTPHSVPMTVECKGTMISAIRRGEAGTAILQVTFDPNSHAEQIVVDGLPRVFLCWNSDGSLQSFSKFPRGGISFDYKLGLLVALKPEGGDPIPIEWDTNAGWNRGDSLWLSQYRLARYDKERYSISLSPGGIQIKSSTPVGDDATVTFNPYRRVVDVFNARERRQFRTE
jgi:hypothetical protein